MHRKLRHLSLTHPSAPPSELQPAASAEAGLYEALVKAPVPILVVDDSGNVILLSQAWLRATGYAADEQRTFAEVTQRLGCPHAPTPFPQKGGSTEVRIRTKGGELRDWFFVSSVLGRSTDGSRLFLCVANDITEKRRAREKVRERERRFHELLEALPVAVYTTDARGRITFYNAGAVALWGQRPKLLRTRWCGAYRLYSSDGVDLPLDKSAMAVAVRENRPVHGYEAICERPDGTKVSLIAYPTPLRDAQGRVIGGVNMLVDITARKLSEVALQDSSNRLELLAREVDHRARNMLASVQAMIRMTGAETVEGYIAALSARVSALSRSHTLMSDSRWSGPSFCKLLQQELAAFRTTEPERIRLAGSDFVLNAEAAQGLTMVFHELASNSARFGALGDPKGRLTIEWGNRDDSLSLLWIETLGQSIVPPAHVGLGLQLIELTVHSRLQGTVQFHWRSSGLICEITVPAKMLSRRRQRAQKQTPLFPAADTLPH